MGKYIAKRLLLLIPTIIIVCIIVFALMRMLPGNAIEMVVYNYQNNGKVNTYEEAEAMLGLDKPTVTQFFIWFGGLLHGGPG